MQIISRIKSIFEYEFIKFMYFRKFWQYFEVLDVFSLEVIEI